MRAGHPGLQSILDKVRQGADVTAEELQQLERQIAELEARAHAHRDVTRPGTPDPAGAPEVPPTLLAGHATREGLERVAGGPDRETIAALQRPAQDILVSSVGIGTYRGDLGPAVDAGYVAAVHAALRAGVTLIDTSLNYRRQRSERAVAAGLRQFVETNGGRRDGIVVCTKGGYLVREAVTPGTIGPGDVVGGTHSMAPAFLADQIDRSRRNLGVATIDVYYLHNPETQLEFVNAPEFMHRIRAAFERLERAVSDGLIRYYGTATWGGYRGGGLSLRALDATARGIAGPDHHFRFVQLPFNLAMPEALTNPVEGHRTVLDLAAELGITVIASASLWQARLARDLPGDIAPMLPGLTTDAQRAIQFSRSTPGIASALVGMADPAHVAENLAVARVPPLTAAEYQRLCSTLAGDPARRV
jgi:aryl-alcohol dehydrogenase-like predicted oxidoreductase